MGEFENNETRNASDTLQSASLPMEINGHEAVDLGLSVKWATCNVGVSAPEEYGDYFAWGETEPKEEYTEANSLTYGQESVGDIAGNVRYDAATLHWGSSWRLPRKEEWEELRNKCIWQWSSREGISGYNVVGPNGNTIFLPAAGLRYEASLYDAASSGRYWSATPDGERNAIDFNFTPDESYLDWGNRAAGNSIRPVSD